MTYTLLKTYWKPIMYVTHFKTFETYSTVDRKFK